jgi:hypothetical protein
MNCPDPRKPVLNGIRITAQITAGLLIGLRTIKTVPVARKIFLQKIKKILEQMYSLSYTT